MHNYRIMPVVKAKRGNSVLWRVAVVLIAAVLCGSCAQARPPVATAAHAASAHRQFMQIVTVLSGPAMQGRSPGTQGLDRARDYLVEQFKAIGLSPAFGDSFTQTFQVALGMAVKYQSLTVGASAAEPERDFNSLGLSATGVFQGPAVFVGYGIVNPQRQYDSYRHLDDDQIKGRVAIAFRFEPQDDAGCSRWTRRDGVWSQSASILRKAHRAARRGAVALLVVNPPVQEAEYGQALKATGNTTAPKPAPIPVMHISSRLFRSMLKPTRHDADAVIQQLQQRADADQPAILPLGNGQLCGDVQLATAHTDVANVGAILPGSGTLGEQVVTVGAHYDHLGYGEFGKSTATSTIHPGADDNASGVGGMLLLARRLVARYSRTNADRRTILFVAFTAEERGMLGSKYLVQNLRDADLTADRIVAMINLDMIGRVRKKQLYVLGVGSARRWQQIIRPAIRNAGLRIRTDRSAIGPSDQASFVEHNIPAIHFYSGMHDDHHRRTDTADKINVPDAIAVVDGIDTVIQALCTDPQPLKFKSLK